MTSKDTEMTPREYYHECKPEELIYRAVVYGYDTRSLDHIVSRNRRFINERFGKLHQTALHEAVVTQSVSVVNLLLKYDADANVGDKYGRTLLFWASYACHPVLLNILLNARASPRQADTSGRNCFNVVGLSTKVDLHGGKIPASLWKDADPQDLEECRKIFRDPTITKPEELFSADVFPDDLFLEEKHRKKNNPE